MKTIIIIFFTFLSIIGCSKRKDPNTEITYELTCLDSQTKKVAINIQSQEEIHTNKYGTTTYYSDTDGKTHSIENQECTIVTKTYKKEFKNKELILTLKSTTTSTCDQTCLDKGKAQQKKDNDDAAAAASADASAATVLMMNTVILSQ